MQKKNIVVLVALYVAATAITYGALSVLHKSQSSSSVADQSASDKATADAGDTSKLITIKPGETKDQQCPLNGKKYTASEAAAWGKRRPLAVMIENHPDARPQSGLSRADLVFEAMAEGGITRFMGVFYCDVQTEDVTLAPIRSARQYFWELASGFNRPLYVHVGGANTPGLANALGHIGDAGWNGQNDMNQFSIGYPTFVRDYNRLGGAKDLATEHTMVTSTEKLWVVAQKRNWTNIAPVINPKSTSSDWKDGYKPWAFQDGTPSQGSVNKISFAFWSGYTDFAVEWDYDAATNTYKRVMAGQPHIDQNTKKQIQVSNAVVMFAEEKGPIDDHKHMLYTLAGTGKALIFQNGKAVAGTWSKADREGELTFLDETGAPVKFVRGETWISLVSATDKITY